MGTAPTCAHSATADSRSVKFPGRHTPFRVAPSSVVERVVGHVGGGGGGDGDGDASTGVGGGGGGGGDCNGGVGGLGDTIGVSFGRQQWHFAELLSHPMLSSPA